MKKIIILFITVIGLSSCKGFLSYDPEDFSAPSTWYKTQGDLEKSMAAVYNYLLRSYQTNLSVWFPMSNDLYFDRSTSTLNKIQFFTHSATTNEIRATWFDLYKGIDNANMFLENADNAQGTVSAELIKNMKGEALFLRAYYHFILTSYWGEVPMKLQSTKSAPDGHVPVSSQKVLYDQIITDLKASVNMLPAITRDKIGGKASISAAKGMLARVSLHAAGRLKEPEYYKEARSWAGSLIDDNIHSLNPKFENVFVNYMKDVYEVKESIFEVDAWGNTYDEQYRNVGFWAGYFSPRFVPSGTTGDGVPVAGTTHTISTSRSIVITTPQLWESYEPTDTRRDWTIATQLFSDANPSVATDYLPEFCLRYPGKFRRYYESGTIYKWGNSTNLPLLRYSDVLLMYAEADNEIENGPTAKGIEYANMVRRRAYGKDADTPSDKDIKLADMDHDKFLKYIQDERGRELAFESHRKLDLIRWGNLLERMTAVKDKLLSFPAKIPNPAGGSDINNPAINNPNSSVNTNMTILSTVFTNISARDYLMPLPADELLVNTAITQNNPGW